ncbi:MAG: hypothetical protein FJ146_16660 [Deltaproteobacteria bacterium]|nr:hypothetical protein [Deltaproteobacteria bacterium]
MGKPILKYGVTRSGKVIGTLADEDFASLKILTADFTAADHFDAFAVFEYLQQRELSRPVISNFVSKFAEYAVFHRLQIPAGAFEGEKIVLGLTTIFDVINHGKRLAVPFF